MFATALRRLLASIPILLVATYLVFWGVARTGDPLQELRAQPNVTQAQVDHVREMRGLDDPLPVQYVRWLEQLTSGSFGEYLLTPRPIGPDLRRVLGNTIQLVVVAELLAVAVALGLGVRAATRRGGAFDRTTTVLSFVGYAMPTFWLALLLQVAIVQVFLATGVRLLPLGSLSSPSPGAGLAFWVDRARHLVLPAITLATFSVATYSRYLRSSMLEALGADHLRTARAKGLPERTVTTRHALRNALVPMVTVATLSFGTLLAGTIVVESVFGLDGMGRYFVTQLARRDPYPILAWTTVVAVAIVIGNLVADLAVGWLDPRTRRG